MAVFPSQFIELNVYTAIALCFARYLMYSSIHYPNNIMHNHQLFSHPKIETLLNQEKYQKPRGIAKTAVAGKRERKRRETAKVTAKVIVIREIRDSPILHQSHQGSQDGEQIKLPRHIQEARCPMTHRINLGEKIIRRQSIQAATQRKSSTGATCLSRKNMQVMMNRLKRIRSSRYLTLPSQEHEENIFEQEMISQIKKRKVLKESFMIKSIEASHHCTPKQKNVQTEKNQQFKAFTNRLKQNKNNSQEKQDKCSKSQLNSNKLIKSTATLGHLSKWQLIGNEHIKQRPNSMAQKKSIRNEFHTTLKKKSVQGNPHALASMIRRKNEHSQKDELYRFVQKLIAKTKKQ